MPVQFEKRKKIVNEDRLKIWNILSLSFPNLTSGTIKILKQIWSSLSNIWLSPKNEDFNRKIKSPNSSKCVIEQLIHIEHFSLRGLLYTEQGFCTLGHNQANAYLFTLNNIFSWVWQHFPRVQASTLYEYLSLAKR